MIRKIRHALRALSGKPDNWRNPKKLIALPGAELALLTNTGAPCDDAFHEHAFMATVIQCTRCHQPFHAVAGWVSTIVTYREAPQYTHLRHQCPGCPQLMLSFDTYELRRMRESAAPIVVETQPNDGTLKVYAKSHPHRPQPSHADADPQHLEVLAQGLRQQADHQQRRDGYWKA